MKLFVLVRPVPDEPSRVTFEQIDAAEAWLEDHERRGVFEDWREFVQTGGWVRVNVPAGMAVDAARIWFEELWRAYPLRDTITWTVDVEVEQRGEGFNTLRLWVAEQQRAAAR